MNYSRISAPIVALAIPLLLVAPGCAADAPADDVSVGTNEEALTNAPADPAHHFNVGVCMGDLQADGSCKGSHCSGTLVAPNVVLTAQHCVFDIEYAESWCDSTFTETRFSDKPLRITTSSSSKKPGAKWYDVDDVYVPAKNLCHDDIALLTLKSRVPSREAIPVPIAIGRDIARNPPSAVAIVGRGAIDSTLDLETYDYTDDDGGLERRILQNVPFTCVASPGRTCEAVDYTSPNNRFSVPPSMFAIGRALESGDSGTAIFDQRGFGFVPVVIGVATATTVDQNGKTAAGLVTRVDIHRDFVVRTMLRALLRR